MEISFEEITLETLYIAVEIINSNPQYNLIENGKENRTETEIKGELLDTNSLSLFLKADETYIGVIDYLNENPNDHSPWLGLFMIHGDYQGFGFGSIVYQKFERALFNQGTNQIRLGVIKENEKGHTFWKSLGLNYYNTVISENQKEIFCYEKIFL